MRYIAALLAIAAGAWFFFVVLPGEIRTATYFLLGFFVAAAVLYKIAHSLETMGDGSSRSRLTSQPRVSAIQL